jgi:hypothetical protein
VLFLLFHYHFYKTQEIRIMPLSSSVLGQPQGVFGISNVEAVETAAGAVKPPNVIPEKTSFDIKVSFEGDPADVTWETARDLGAEYEITCYIESIGGNYEGLLCTTKGKLVAGQDKYEANMTIPGGIPSGPPATTALAQGLYMVGTVVKFTTAPSRYVGYFQNLLVDIKNKPA